MLKSNSKLINDVFDNMSENLALIERENVQKYSNHNQKQLNIINGLDKIAEGLERIGKITAANIVTNMLVKIAGNEAEELDEGDRPTLPPPPNEELLPEEVEPLSYTRYLSPGNRNAFVISLFHHARMVASELLQKIREKLLNGDPEELKEILGINEVGEDTKDAVEYIIGRFEDKLTDIHDLAASGKVPYDVLLERYKDFIRRAKHFLKEEPKAADVDDAKDKKQKKADMIKYLKMFGFKGNEMDKCAEIEEEMLRNLG